MCVTGSAFLKRKVLDIPRLIAAQRPSLFYWKHVIFQDEVGSPTLQYHRLACAIYSAADSLTASSARSGGKCCGEPRAADRPQHS